MKVFSAVDMEVGGSAPRPTRVFHETPEFKMRAIDLPPGGSIPPCEMASHVVFVCLAGEVCVTVDGEEATLTSGAGLVSAPATVSMRTDGGARLLGIQVAPAGGA